MQAPFTTESCRKLIVDKVAGGASSLETIELSMLDCSPEIADSLTNLIAESAGSTLHELHFNYFQASVKTLDKVSLNKLVEKCGSLEKLTVTNMFRLPNEARKAMAQMVAKVLQKSAATIKQIDLQGFSFSEEPGSGVADILDALKLIQKE